DLSEEVATALVNIGAGNDPRVMKGLIELVCNGFPNSQVAASLLLKGSTVAGHIPALVEALRETTRTDNAAAQSYILEILLHYRSARPVRSRAVSGRGAGTGASVADDRMAGVGCAGEESHSQSDQDLRRRLDPQGRSRRRGPECRYRTRICRS